MHLVSDSFLGARHGPCSYHLYRFLPSWERKRKALKKGRFICNPFTTWLVVQAGEGVQQYFFSFSFLGRLAIFHIDERQGHLTKGQSITLSKGGINDRKRLLFKKNGKKKKTHQTWSLFLKRELKPGSIFSKGAQKTGPNTNDLIFPGPNTLQSKHTLYT